MSKKRFISILAALMCAMVFVLMIGIAKDTPADAAEETAVEQTEEAADNSTGSKALAAGIVVGLAAAAGAIGMGIAVAKSTESMARQPEIAGKINSTMMLGMVFIETAIIYALIVAILIIFVL